jgi:hypothetical protein
MLNLAPHIAKAIDGARARVRPFPWWLKPFLARGVIGITLGRTIYVSEQYLASSAARVERLIRHELVHVQQVNRLGLLRFLWRYTAEYVRNLRAGMTSAAAYRRISFEVEAYDAEEVG